MKRILIAAVVLLTGATVFSAYRYSTTQFRQQRADTHEAWQNETRDIAQLENEQAALEEQIRNLKHQVAAERSSGIHRPPAGDAEGGANFSSLSPEQSEALLAELGFNWNSTGDHLIVSKDTLRQVRLVALSGLKLSETVCQVLAITPEERDALDNTIRRAVDDLKNGNQRGLQREEPSGDIVAKYTLTLDPGFGQSVSNTLVSEITSTLGAERSGLLRHYFGMVMGDLGWVGGQTATLIVRRDFISGGEPRLTFDLRHSRGGTSAQVSPMIFPEQFRPVFPGGWPDIAKREGFELPKDFGR